MLENGVGSVKNFSNGKNGLVARVCGRLFVIVIMLIEKKREPGFLTRAN